MLKRIFWLFVIVVIAVGGIKHVANNPHESAKDGAHLVNETTDTSAGFIEGIFTFVGELDF